MRFSRERPVKVVMLGAGGTGGHIAPHLYRLLYALERPVRFIICDGDVVEQKNLVRQNFTPADLGENKAKVLAERYSAVFGMETEYVPEFIESEERLQELLTSQTWQMGPEYNAPLMKEQVILIGAVDNNRSRQLCHSLFYQMDELVYMNEFLAASSGEKEHMLGKFLYFTLANLLVEKEALSDLCESMGIPYAGGNRLSVSDAFRSATGDIRERIPVTSMGESHIYLAYCRDNKRTSGVLSRELVKETLNQQTNRYEKLANISYDKEDGIFRCDNLVMDDAVDVPGCCRRAEELFELYQRCANRKQIETICTNYLRSIEATKLSITGHMYFVPRTYMDKVDIFEDFINLLGGLNRNDTPLMVNSFYIIDDEKQRAKMTEEFYAAVKKEIATYQERADYLIKSGSQSPAVMDRWVLKIQGLEEKKRHYEQVLRRELDGLDDEFSTLKFLSQELQMRSRSIRFQKAA